MLEFKHIKKPVWQVFTLCFVLAALLFLPMGIRDAMDGTIFHYVGDYNEQEITFWQYCNEFIKQGGSFSWECDLGSGFLNAFSFYGIGSPYFWISEWVPSNWMPWCMVVLFCLKFAVAGSSAYLWTKRWVQNNQYAMIAAILYAFCGHNIYSIFYNHFLDATSLFPLLLVTLDMAVIDAKWAFFPIVVALNLSTNYYFFVGEVVFLIIYFAFMQLGKLYRINPKSFGRLAFESLLGVACGSVLLIPAVLSLAQNPRTLNYLNDYGFICYNENQKYMAIFSSMFLMPDVPYNTTIFPLANVRWQSLSAYLPVVGITGGIALNRANRKHPFARILKFSVVCAFVPMLNAMFTLENKAYYARWFYMPLLILSAATAIALDKKSIKELQWADAWKTTFIFTAAFAALGLVPSAVSLYGLQFGITESPSIFWLLWGISVAGLIAGAVVIKKNPDENRLAYSLLSVIMIFTFVYGETHILLSRYTSETDENGHGWIQSYDDIKNVKGILPSDDFYRTESMGNCNLNIPLGTSSENYFSSTVSPGIFSFYNGAGFNRGVKSIVSQEHYGFRSLLSTRFLLVSILQEDTWNATALDSGVAVDSTNAGEIIDLLSDTEDDITYVPAEWVKNWKEYGRTNEFIIYENQNFLPMGYTYKYYITQEQYKELTAEESVHILLKALVLTNEQIEKYGDKLQQLPEAEFDKLTYSDFVKDCADRREQTADTFETNNYGFTATTSFDTDELVFFSVPYEKNAFTATVNGEPVDVEEVDCGLMAIPVPAGEADIVVTYHTPGLKEGITISIAGIIIWILYALVCYNKGKKKGTPELQEAKESTEAVE